MTPFDQLADQLVSPFIDGNTPILTDLEEELIIGAVKTVFSAYDLAQYGIHMSA